MPPKAKFSKEEIIQGAVKLIQEQGFEKLTARSLAEALEVSTKPIFGAFKNMEEVEQECQLAVSRLYDQYSPDISEKQFYSAEKYVSFAKNEPSLFKFRYLNNSEQCGNFQELMKKIDSNYDSSIKNVQEAAGGCSIETAEKLYRDVWLFAHGIACLCAYNQCSFSDQEIHNLIKEVAFGVSSL